MTGGRLTLALFAILAVSAAIAANVQLRQVRDDSRRLEPPHASELSVVVRPQDGTGIARAAQAFLERHGGSWTFRADPRRDRIVLAQGSGLPLPGARRDAAATRRTTTLEDLVAPARAFIDANRDWIGPGTGELVFNPVSSQLRGRLASLYFDWQIDRVPVEGAMVFVRLNSGRITQFGSRWVGGVEIFPEPEISGEEARAALLAYSGDAEDARFLAEPSLLVTPIDLPGGGLDYRMVWRMRYRVPGREPTWEGRVDARTGAVIGFRDTNVYAHARGGVFPRTVHRRDETPAPLPFLEVAVDGRIRHADAAGRFGYDGGEVRAALDSRNLQTFCFDCVNPAQPAAGAPFGAGSIDFGTSGGDQFGNGRSTSPGRNVYYHLHQVRRIAGKWLPTMRWLRRARLTANVNLDLACNAFYNHDELSINFYRSGEGCNNTGMIADVIQHEWGHAIDFATLVLDGSTGEGTADVVAMHMSRDPSIAPGFYSDGRPIRTLDSATNAMGLMTWPGVLAGVCDFPTGGRSIHCIGTVYGQTAWDLAQALVGRYGEYTGWRVSERLFYQSLPDAGSLDPESPLAIYPAYLQADDDDGNLVNGTPNADLIYAAFLTHGIAQDPVPASTRPARLPQPVVEATPRCDRIDLRWQPVEGAVRYEVLRTELVSDGPLYPVATLGPGALGYGDEVVLAGFDYRYAVLAVDAGGRESTAEPGAAVRIAARPILSVVGVDVSDTARGNRSGSWDPGETLEIVLTLANGGDTPATGVRGRLEAITPGVTLIENIAIWPDLPAGDAAAAERPFVVQIDATVACGTSLELRLVPDEAGGCAGGDASWFPLQVGTPDDRVGHFCDTTPACFVEPSFGGLELATPGACGEVLLRWLPAESRCANAELSYDVFRGEGPGILLPATRIATAVSAAGWRDRLLVPGNIYRYLVQAVDSRSGPEANTRVVTAVAPAGDDVEPPVFSSALSAETGADCGETELGWEPALESCSLPVAYRLYRSTEPDFTPGPATQIATTTTTAYSDLAEAGVTYHYAVRAVDDAGNASAHTPRAAARARVFDREIFHTGFEHSNGGWRTIEPNDAERGNWEWGDPEAGVPDPQDDDATVVGSRCWMTGIARQTPEGDNNDVDFGTTTLASARYDIAGAVDPVVRYARWFTNDRSTNAGDPRDSLRVHVSDDDGVSWSLLEEVGAGTPLAWVTVDLPLAGIVEATDRLRLRFTAADIGGGIEDASKVEAGIDEFSLIDRDQGCGDSGTGRPVDDVIRGGN